MRFSIAAAYIAKVHEVTGLHIKNIYPTLKK